MLSLPLLCVLFGDLILTPFWVWVRHHFLPRHLKLTKLQGWLVRVGLIRTHVLALKLAHGHFADATEVLVAVVRHVRAIHGFRLLRVGVAEHHLLFVEAAAGMHLRHDVDFARRVVAKVHVDGVTVGAARTRDEAVRRLHLALPRHTFAVLATLDVAHFLLDPHRQLAVHGLASHVSGATVPRGDPSNAQKRWRRP